MVFCYIKTKINVWETRHTIVIPKVAIIVKLYHPKVYFAPWCLGVHVHVHVHVHTMK